MHEIISWFQLNYPHLRDELKNCMHNFDDTSLNPYHLESDCWSHTMMVCKIAEIEKFDKVVQISALLHDIGKPFVRKVNPKNNHVQFFDHEIVSAYMSIEILKKMIKEEIVTKDEAVEIFLLVAMHSVFHKSINRDTLVKQFKNHKTLYLHLLDLNKCDRLGRFCEGWKNNYQKRDYLRDIALDMKDKELPNEIFEIFENGLNCDEIAGVLSRVYNA